MPKTLPAGPPPSGSSIKRTGSFVVKAFGKRRSSLSESAELAAYNAAGRFDPSVPSTLNAQLASLAAPTPAEAAAVARFDRCAPLTTTPALAPVVSITSRRKAVPTMTTTTTPEPSGSSSPKLASGPAMMAEVLRKAGRPMHTAVITAEVIRRDRRRPADRRVLRGKTPADTLAAKLAMSHTGGGVFVRTAPGVYALREWSSRVRHLAPTMPEQGRRARKPAARKLAAEVRESVTQAA